MLSMTGFGTATASNAEGVLSVQISAVNGRGCQVNVRSDLRDLAAEEAVRRQVRDRLQRGSISVHLSWQSAHALAADHARLRQAWRELAVLARELGAPAPTVEAVAGLPGVGRGGDPTGLAELATAAAEQALTAVETMRRHEGAALARALAGQAGELRRLHDEMRAAASGRVAAHHARLLERLRELLAADHPVDDAVLVRELALYSDRIDISEELVRLGSHLDALTALIAGHGDDAVGRQLEFLLQELGREVNTTGSKANDLALTRLVLAAKNLLEQVREQAANLA